MVWWGDAHYLFSYFEDGKKFDLIFSSAVFEHLAMPWKVAEEISKMLRCGGYFFVETLEISTGYLDKLWQNREMQDLGIDLEGWKLFRELIAYSRDNVIDLYESALPFTKHLLKILNSCESSCHSYG